MTYKIFNSKYLETLSTIHETPCYIYDTRLLGDTLDYAQSECVKQFADQAIIHYAVKANDNIEVLAKIKQAGFGIDCVSGGEIEHALDCGFRVNQIVFAGVGKQDWEIELALNVGIYAFNCESLQEVEVINELALAHNKTAKVMLRINPGIDAKTHKNISTGMYENKFGIMFSDVCKFLPHLKNLTQIELIGLHYHIGSQINDMNVFAELAAVVSEHYNVLYDSGIYLTDLNLGGGLGVDYVNPQINPITDFNRYFATLKENLRLPEAVKIHFELGRSLVAQCGIMLSKVLYIKNTAETLFAIIDAGMNDLMRPALYEAKHVILPLIERDLIKTYHVVGPVCESTDIFAKNLALSELNRGDVVAILTSGAYGRVLANQYNRRRLIKEYLI